MLPAKGLREDSHKCFGFRDFTEKRDDSGPEPGST
jgi:hypothetical protein